MSPHLPDDLIVRSSWRLDAFASAFGAAFWGAVFLCLAWLVAEPGVQLGSWLGPLNQVPVPFRVWALMLIGGGLLVIGALEIIRSLRPVAAILGKDALMLPTLLGWRSVLWTDVVRVSLDKGRFLTFAIKREGRTKRHGQTIIDLSRLTTSRETIARKLASIRADLADGWVPHSTSPDPLRQERDFGHHIWS